MAAEAAKSGVRSAESGALDTFGDAARLRVVPADPPLDAEAGSQLVAALTKLMEQFAREGRCGPFAVATAAGGALVLIAWEGEPLSGCSHDKIAGVLNLHAGRGGRRLLDAPPIVLEVDGVARCVDRLALRTLVAGGRFSLDGAHWDTRCDSVGAWRSGARRTARDTWLAPLIARTTTP